MPERMRPDEFGDSGAAGDLPDDPGGPVAVQPTATGSQEDRPLAPLADRQVDRPRCARRTDKMTAPLALYNLESVAGGGPVGAVFAGLSVLCVPCVIGFVFLQRRLMEGIGYRGVSR
jgi:hypothetical protein